MPERRPFEETIVDYIESMTRYDIHRVSHLIKETKISKNYDVIIGAWVKRLLYLHLNYDLGVPANLIEQKHEAEAEAAKNQAQQRSQIAEALSFGQENC